MRRALLLSASLLGLAAPANAWLPHGSGPPVLTLSASAVGITAQWTTVTSGTTVLACGTTLGTYNINGVIDPSLSNVVTHYGTVPQLVPSTLYFCQAQTVSGGATYTSLASITTTALPTSTPLISATFGAVTTPQQGQNAGDTYYNFQSNDGKTYVVMNDGSGWTGGTTASATNIPMSFGTIASPGFIGTNVNLLSNFTAHGEPPKLFSVWSYQGIMYGIYSNLCGTAGSGSTLICSAIVGGYAQEFGGILKSPDHGATWANWQNPVSYNANGTVPSPYNGVTMFDAVSGCSQGQRVNFGADNGTPFPTYAVDGSETYDYIVCAQPNGDAAGAAGLQFNGDTQFLARIPMAYLATLDSTKIQYFIGGSSGNGIDGSLAGAWSSSYSGAAPIFTDAGHTSNADVQYMPSTGRYVMFDWYWNNIGVWTSSTWKIREAAHPWGPWTTISTTVQSPQGWYNPVPYHPSAIAATPNGNAMTLMIAGAFGQAGSCPSCFYQLNLMPVTLNTH